MSEIERLINELCPNGVEWKTLGELGEFQNTGVDKKIIPTEKEVLLLNYMDIYRNNYIDKHIPKMIVSASDRKIQTCTVLEGDIFVTPTSETKDDIGHAAVITKSIENCCYSYHIMRFRLFYKQNLTSFYIRYLFETDLVQNQIFKLASGMTRFGLSKDKFASIKIPVPPIEVQREIVRILDNFTELTAELTAELDNRKKQYEYYRDTLLTFDNTVEWKTLGDIAEISRGVRVVKKQLFDSGQYPVYQNCLSPMGYYDKFNYNANTTYLISAGAAGEIGFSGVDFWAADDCFVFANLAFVANKYIFYYLQTKQDFIRSNVRKASIPRLSRTVIEKLAIQVPPLAEQQRIVDILDRFDSLCNDITKGLPAEIEARKKQYEYYRDKLLTFKQLNAEV